MLDTAFVPNMNFPRFCSDPFVKNSLSETLSSNYSIFMKIHNKISGFTEIVEYPSFEAGMYEFILCENIQGSNRNIAWLKIKFLFRMDLT
jgi:hypothetical protein